MSKGLRIFIGVLGWMNLIAVTIALASCASTPAPPVGTKVVYQRVEVPVQRPCPVTRPAKPKPLARPLPKAPRALIDLLTAKLLEWAGPGGYGERADDAITTCTKP